MKDLAILFAQSAILAHVVGSLVAGSLDPLLWPALLFWVIVLIVAPCIALGIAVVSGALR